MICVLCSAKLRLAVLLPAIALVLTFLSVHSAALANSAPQYCVNQVGNTFVGTCDQYFSSVGSAADTLSPEWLAQKTRGSGYTYYWDGPAYYGSYGGPVSVRITRPAYWMNGPYKVKENYVVDVVPVCHQGPQPPGSRPYPQGLVESEACPYDLVTYRIDLLGASSTHYLPAGPAVPLSAYVTRNGAAASGHFVTITVRGLPTNGVTDANGAFQFTYTPPQQISPSTLVESVTATCSLCSNVATKTISVEPNQQSAAPQSCPAPQAASTAPMAAPMPAPTSTPAPAPAPTVADASAPTRIFGVPGRFPTFRFHPHTLESEWGNPVDAVTGEKIQFEWDWTDQALHPLQLARRYASYGVDIPAAGLGTRWTHNWAARASVDGDQARITLGVDGTVLFTRNSATGNWVRQGGADTLAQLASGLQYVRADDESTWLFSADGRLQSVADRRGWRYTLVYDVAGRLTSVTNTFGRSLQFGYDGAGSCP